MTPKQADRLIKSAQAVTLRHALTAETTVGVIVRRTRWNIELADGALLNRSEMMVVS